MFGKKSENIEGSMKTEQRLKNFLEHFEEIYFEAGLEGTIRYVSPSVTHASGYTPEELAGQNILSLYVYPQKREAYLKELTEKGIIKDHALELFNKEKEIRKCLITSRILNNNEGTPIGIMGIIRDVTEKIENTRKLHESENRYKTLLEHANAQIIHTDAQGKIYIINKRAAAFLNQTPENLKGKQISEVYPKGPADKLMKNLHKSVLNKEGIVFEILMEENNNKFWFLTHIQPVVDNKGDVSGTVIINTDITDRKDYEVESQKLTMAVEKSTASIMITESQGDVIYCNPCHSKMTGFKFREIARKKANFITGNDLSKETQSIILKSLEKGDSWEGELKSKKKNGEYFWEEVTITPVYNSEGNIQNYIRVGLDITANKKITEYQEKSLKNLEILNETSQRIINISEKEDIFHLLGEQLAKIIPEQYFILGTYNPSDSNISNRFLHIEKGVLSTFFKMSKISSTKTLKRKINNEDYQKLIKGKKIILEGGFTQLTNGMIGPGLNKVMIRTFGIENIIQKGIVRNGSLYGVFSLFTRKQAPGVDMDLLETFFSQASSGIERLKLEADLTEAKEKAEEMNRIKTAFLANMSHELRTPLNGILGFSELLLEQTEDKRNREMINVINQSGLRLLATLNTILDFTTLEVKTLDIYYSHENLVKILKEIADHFFPEAEKKGIKLVYKPAKKEIGSFIAKSPLKKVVSHLISNAIKFTNKGSVTLSVTTTGSVFDSEKIIISITDTGIGIPDEEVDHIFDEFRQASEGLTRKFEGTGLGLTISKKFIELLDGEIQVNSKLNKGTTFTVSIPIYKENPMEA